MLCNIEGYGMHGYGSGMGFMMIFWLLVLALIVIFVYKKHNGLNNNEALQLLKLKFVKGEINEEEYISKKSILSKK